MEIIGHGFLARHLEPLRDAHPGALVLAAGLPRQKLPEAEHVRETILVREVIDHCRRRGQLLVFFSTASMYGEPGCRGREDDPIFPSTRYGRHKRGLETLIRDSGVEHLILRLSFIVGPHGPGHRLIPTMVEQVMSGRVQVHRGARRDIIYVTDFVDIVDRLLAAGISNEIVNAASGDCADITEIVDHIEARLKLTAERTMVSGGTCHCPSVEKLGRLLPGFGFWPGYYRHVIERYLEETQ